MKKSIVMIIGLIMIMSLFAGCGNEEISETVEETTEEEVVKKIVVKETVTDDGMEEIIGHVPETTEPEPEKEQWAPEVGMTWHYQLNGELDTSYDVDVYGVDLFNIKESEISDLHENGKKVICHFSGGTYVDGREDMLDMTASILGNSVEGAVGEMWLDFKRMKVEDTMKARISLAEKKGCDAVAINRIDSSEHDSGHEASRTEQIEYAKMLATEAHSKKLAAGMQNGLTLTKFLVDDFDFIVVERCVELDECGRAYTFISNEKPVFGVEYDLDHEEYCVASEALKYETVKADEKLEGPTEMCP